MAKYCLIKRRSTGEEIVELDKITRRQLMDEMSRGDIYRVGTLYNTLDELKFGEKIHEHLCKSCGSIFGTNYHEIGKDLREKNLCFTCNFWEGIIQDFNKSEKHIVVDGVKYTIGPEKTPEFGFRGYGGSLFIIKFLNSDRVTKTTNLWCQGDVPERFRERLPDNAKFINTDY